MKQRAFTIVVELVEDKIAELEDYLRPIGDDIRGEKAKNIIDLDCYKNLHYCCFVVLNDRFEATGTKPACAGKPILVFEGNIDGKVRHFLDDMVQRNGTFLRKVFSYCHGYSAHNTDAELVHYLLDGDKGANTFYIGHPGRTCAAIKDENRLYYKIIAYLDSNRDSLTGLSPDRVRKSIQSVIRKSGNFAFADRPLRIPLAARFGPRILVPLLKPCVLKAGLGVALLGCIAVLSGFLGNESHRQFVWLMLGIGVLYTGWLRWRESTDLEDTADWKPGNTILQEFEDRQLQNHLTSMTYVKSGWLRLLTLRVVLFAVSLAARFVATRGNLSNIVTIHFARWVIVDGGPDGRKRLLFFSNYDGGWENYLGEFIDQASVGLTGVWSNSELGPNRGFPSSRWLVLGGARNEQKFKAYARNSQHRELLWYSAYPNVSLKNIGNNKEIRDYLYKEPKSVMAWLRRL